MAVTYILQFHYQSTSKIWGKSNRHDIIFSNIELFRPGLPVRFSLKCLLQYYPLTTTQGINHFASCENIVSPSQASSLHPLPLPPPPSVYTSVDSIDIKLFGFVRKSMKQLHICIINVWGMRKLLLRDPGAATYSWNDRVVMVSESLLL